MKQVKAFQTSDGEIHTDELAATYHEFAIEIRGVIQSHPDFTNLRNETINLGFLCQKITHNADALVNVIRRYRQKINGIHSRKAKPAPSPAS